MLLHLFSTDLELHVSTPHTKDIVITQSPLPRNRAKTHRTTRRMRHPPQNTRNIDNTPPLGRRPRPHLLLRQPLLLQHLPNHRPLTQPHPANINIIHPIPRLHTQIRRLGPGVARHPRTVDRVLDAAEFLYAGINHVLDFCLVGRVGFDAQGFHGGVH